MSEAKEATPFERAEALIARWQATHAIDAQSKAEADELFDKLVNLVDAPTATLFKLLRVIAKTQSQTFLAGVEAGRVEARRQLDELEATKEKATPRLVVVFRVNYAHTDVTGVTRTERIRGPLIKVGTLPTSHLRLSNETFDGKTWDVSALHAIIELDASGATVTDMRSAGGTRVNGQVFTKYVGLKPGDVLQFGRVVVTLIAFETE